MEIFKGEGFSWRGGAAVGRLCFSAESVAKGRDALLWVCGEAPRELPSSAVGVILLGREGGLPPLLPCPVLTLPCLDPSLGGRIAILDGETQTLFVDPDLETLKSYGSPAVEENPPLLYRWVTEPPEMLRGEEGILWKAPPLRDEEALFECYRAAAERNPQLPLTVLLSAEEPDRLRTQLRGVLRGAVYGRFSLLFSGIGTREEWESCHRLCHEVFCDLESEGRECNGYLPRGLLLDRGMPLLESHDTHRPDFLCVDAGRLFRSLCGTGEMTADRIRILREALGRAFGKEEVWLWVRSLGDLPVCRGLSREGGLRPRGWILP